MKKTLFNLNGTLDLTRYTPARAKITWIVEEVQEEIKILQQQKADLQTMINFEKKRENPGLDFVGDMEVPFQNLPFGPAKAASAAQSQPAPQQLPFGHAKAAQSPPAPQQESSSSASKHANAASASARPSGTNKRQASGTAQSNHSSRSHK